MNRKANRVRQIFEAVFGIGDLSERSKFLLAKCDGNSELRAEVEALLKAHDEAVEQETGLFQTDGVDRADGDNQNSFEPGATRESNNLNLEAEGQILASKYKLRQNIGEGGMGSVWVAEQLQPVKRKVAIKLVKAGMDSKQVLARFEAERQALAVMDHPNIAKVFDGGMTDQGRPFFVMEYVKGIPFTEYCDQARVPLRERLELFIPVCQAIQHAHQKGIVHRDLKPSNILICLYDGKPVPKVIDFGLAKALHQPLTEHSIFTGHGMMVGTPLYMSPEQAELNNLDVDTRTDIYSLGVMLYELLTGTTPLEKAQFKEAAFNEVLRIIKEVEPPRPSTRLSGSDTLPSIAAQRNIEPRQLCKSLSGDLDWIVMKSLEKERTRRYETANEFSRDIVRFLNDDVVEACPPSRRYLLWKWYRRHRTAATVFLSIASIVILAFCFIGCALSYANREAERARVAEAGAESRRLEAESASQQAIESLGQARAAKKATDIAKQDLRVSLAVSQFHLARVNLEQNDFESARKSLDSIDRNLRNIEWSAAYRLAESSGQSWDLGRASAIGMSNNRKHLAICGFDKHVRIVDMESGQSLSSFTLGKDASAIAVSDDGSVVAVAQVDRENENSEVLQVFEIESGTVSRFLKGHSKRIERIFFLGSSKELVSAADDNQVIIWNAEKTSPEKVRGFSKLIPETLCIDVLGNTIAVSTEEKTHLLSTELGELNSGVLGENKLISLSTDGTLLATSDWYSLDVYRIDSKCVLIQTIEIDAALGKNASAIQTVPQKDMIAVAVEGNWETGEGKRRHEIGLFNVVSGKLEKQFFPSSKASIESLFFDSTGSRLVSSDWYAEDFSVWRPFESIETFAPMADDWFTCAIEYDAKRKCVFCGGSDRVVRCFDRRSGEVLWSTNEFGSYITSLLFLPSKSRLVVADERSNSFAVLNSNTGALVADLTLGREGKLPVKTVVMPNDQFAVSSAGNIRIFDSNGLNEVDLISLPGTEIAHLRTCSSSGRLFCTVVSSSASDRPFSGSLVAVDSSSKDFVELVSNCGLSSLQVSRDGRFVACGDDQNSIELYNAKDGSLIQRLSDLRTMGRTYLNSVSKTKFSLGAQASFTADSTRLVGCGAGEAVIWSLDSFEKLISFSICDTNYDKGCLTAFFDQDARVRSG